jgi:hypothetical protein
MKKSGVRLLAGCLTFLIGTVVSNVWFLYTRMGPPSEWEVRVDAGRWIKPKPLTRIRGMDACGATGNYHTIDLSDGTRITNSCERLSSARRANEELQKRLSQATEIIEQQPNLDGTGHKVGEKVVARAGKIVSLNTYENSFCVTEAAYLDHLRWYERR